MRAKDNEKGLGCVFVSSFFLALDEARLSGRSASEWKTSVSVSLLRFPMTFLYHTQRVSLHFALANTLFPMYFITILLLILNDDYNFKSM